MLNPEISSSPSYSVPVGRYVSAGARGFGRALWAVRPGPVLLIIAVEAFVQACLAVRLYFSFQGGDPTGRLAQMHHISDTLVSPFRSWDGTILFSKGVFEISTIVAMDAYLFAAIGAIVLLVMMRTFVAFGRYVVRQTRLRHERRALAAQQEAPGEADLDSAPVTLSSNNEVIADQVA
jgi:hypothetical protein